MSLEILQLKLYLLKQDFKKWCQQTVLRAQAYALIPLAWCHIIDPEDAIQLATSHMDRAIELEEEYFQQDMAEIDRRMERSITRLEKKL